MNIIIKKFGGTSVSSIDRIERAISYIKRTRKSGYFVVVVVSAMGKETDRLLKLTTGLDEYKKTDGALNTAIGNLMADAVFKQSVPIFKKRYNLDVDLVLLNHGGIRAPLPKGPIFTKTAFNIMPFENKVVVAQMKGKVVMELVNYLTKAKRAHPISGMTLHITKKGKLKKLEIQGKTIDLNKIYNVATSDYLYNGGDRMEFFKKSKTVFDLDYKIRAILIDYFTAQDTLNPKRDQRFIYTN